MSQKRHRRARSCANGRHSGDPRTACPAVDDNPHMNALPVLREMVDAVGSSLYETIRHRHSPVPNTHYHRLAQMDGRTLNGIQDTLVAMGVVSASTVTLSAIGMPIEASPVVAYFCPTTDVVDLATGGALMGATGRALWNGTDGLLAGMDIGLRRLLKIHPAAR